MPHPDRIAIVGASLGGLRVAQALRGRGKFEGTITLIGAEPHYPYDRPPLSKQVLAGEWGPERTLLDPPDKVDELGLDLRLGVRAESLDLEAREAALSDGSRVAFDSLIIATGATPRTLPNTPDLDGIYTLRTIDDSMRLRAELANNPRVAVVGAGFIGAEVAAVAR
ncbi:MAG: NAD(P)/FAD-dependent oxidoreductase, partial [Dehalococcoidia bacterium]|nr:NAD(P)/FAD-dependent oxidoreductase [Dehalococcoidia bacterium]